MMDEETSRDGLGGVFHTTRWSILHQRKLDEIIQIYWKPVYVYLRRKNHKIEEAQDLTQAFFTRFLEKDYAGQADQSRGRFRNFLRACVDHFVSDEMDRDKAIKRGSGKIISLDLEAAEQLLSFHDSPDHQFNRQWAQSILDEALTALANEYEERGQSEKFAMVRPFLSSGSCQDRSTLHRARRRLGEIIRQHVSETVESGEAMEEELTFLFESLRQGPAKSS